MANFGRVFMFEKYNLIKTTPHGNRISCKALSKAKEASGKQCYLL